MEAAGAPFRHQLQQGEAEIHSERDGENRMLRTADEHFGRHGWPLSSNTEESKSASCDNKEEWKILDAHCGSVYEPGLKPAAFYPHPLCGITTFALVT